MNKNIEMTVLDAGGRYGIHPTYKTFTGELNYHLFEPDPIEYARLKAKYLHRATEIKVNDLALDKNNGKLTINYFKNRAMSSSSIRNPISSLFAKGSHQVHCFAFAVNCRIHPVVL